MRTNEPPKECSMDMKTAGEESTKLMERNTTIPYAEMDKTGKAERENAEKNERKDKPEEAENDPEAATRSEKTSV